MWGTIAMKSVVVELVPIRLVTGRGIVEYTISITTTTTISPLLNIIMAAILVPGPRAVAITLTIILIVSIVTMIKVTFRFLVTVLLTILT